MSESSRPVLEARGLYHIYQVGNVKTVALRGADLTLAHASWTAVMGPSGSGKSTLLHILAGLLEPSAGSVSVDGEDITRLPSAAQTAWRRRSVGLVLQRDNLHPSLNVVDNIALPLRLQGEDSGAISERASALLEHVGLAERRDHRVGQLSGGEAQRVAVAVAIATSPRVLLADEPTGELDSTTASNVLDLLDTLMRREGLTILTVTHNRQVTERARGLLTMRDGVLIDAT